MLEWERYGEGERIGGSFESSEASKGPHLDPRRLQAFLYGLPHDTRIFTLRNRASAIVPD